MKWLGFFCVVYLGGASIAASSWIDDEYDLVRRHGLLVVSSNLQRRYIEEVDTLLGGPIFPRATRGRGGSTRALASSSRSSSPGSGWSSPRLNQPPSRSPSPSRLSPGSPRGERERSRVMEAINQLGIHQGDSTGDPLQSDTKPTIRMTDYLSQSRSSQPTPNSRRREDTISPSRPTQQETRRPHSPPPPPPSTIHLSQASSLRTPPRTPSTGPYSLENLNYQHPQPHSKTHIKLRGPGTMSISTNSNQGRVQQVPAGHVAQAGGESADQIHGSVASRTGGSATLHATGKYVSGFVDAQSGRGASILQTMGRNGQMKIALPGQAAKIEAKANQPGGTVGVKVKSHGPSIVGVSGFNLPPREE